MIVEIEGLRKVYEGKQRVVAVDGIDLSVHRSVIWLSGNGPTVQGKTTAISITQRVRCAQREHIAGIVLGTVSGEALYRGRTYSYNTGSCLRSGEHSSLPLPLLRILGSMRRSAPDRLLEQFHLTERARTPSPALRRSRTTGPDCPRCSPTPKVLFSMNLALVSILRAVSQCGRRLKIFGKRWSF